MPLKRKPKAALCSCAGRCYGGMPAVRCRVKRGARLLTQQEADGEMAATFDGPTLPLGGRPTEAVSGVALMTTVYGFLTQASVPPAAAAIAAVAVAFLPLLVSKLVDARRDRQR